MGVHNAEVYGDVKRLLGIPEDEPIFIIRAQDRFATDAVDNYTGLVCGGTAMTRDRRSWRHRMNEHSDAIYDWQEDNPDKVKDPD